MTLLNWILNQDSVLILSDTLSLSGDTKLPRSLTTKVYPAPHIGAVITGAGSASIITQFYFRVVNSFVIFDVIQLMEFAPELLRVLQREFELTPLHAMTTTIYTFGISQDDGKFVGIAYRSTKNFEPEILQYGVYAKPPPQAGQLEAVEGPSDLVKVALDQQSSDRSLPQAERVGIGGDLWEYRLGKSEDNSLIIEIRRCIKMPYFDSDRESILLHLP